MLLLTGATGTVGQALLRRLIAADRAGASARSIGSVRCLVRDPRRLGASIAGDAERGRLEIARGDLAQPGSFDDALRDVDTVVHLAAAIRDQAGGSIEQLTGAATVELVQAAERAGVSRFVFFSAIGADPASPVRFMRAKGVAERVVVNSPIEHTVFAPSIIYAPDDPYLTLLARMAWLPVVPIPGAGDARFEPIWAADVADCVLAALPGGRAGEESAGARYELAGPDVLTHREIVELVLAGARRRRPLVAVPAPVTRRALQLVERLLGDRAFATWDEAQLMDVPMLAAAGTADVNRLGVRPHPMAAVLGV